MSKITRKKLTRGVMLGTEHVHAPLDAIGVADLDQVKVQWAPFRVTFNFPVLNDAAGTGSGKPISIPFTLPPLQQFFDPINKEAVKSTPAIVLDEMSFSFDSRAERGTIRVSAGFPPDRDVIGRCDVNIAILEKASDGLQYDKEVSSVRIPSSAIVGSQTERFNPVVIDNINAVIDPYKFYLLTLAATSLYDSTDPVKLAMPNATVSLRFRHQMVVGVTAGQNAPSAPPGLKGAAASISITTPALGSTISAADVQDEMTKVDEVFLSKLNGGFPVDSTYHIDADSGYDVIAVPMFANPVAIKAGEAERLPYLVASSGNFAFDRRVIPINEPLLIHHVIVAANYVDAYAPLAAQPPQSATFTHYVGVGIGTGIRSDLFTYDQIASKQWTPGDVAAVIDKSTPSAFPAYLLELVDIPLVGSGARGYSAQGDPFYVGRGITPRTAGGTNTAGREQFIEIRWRMHNNADMRTAAATDVYVGTGGHWVYLICEKRLTGRRS